MSVITTDPDYSLYVSPDFCREMIEEMRDSGIQVHVKEEVPEHFAIIDDDLVWHGWSRSLQPLHAR